MTYWPCYPSISSPPPVKAKNSHTAPLSELNSSYKPASLLFRQSTVVSSFHPADIVLLRRLASRPSPKVGVPRAQGAPTMETSIKPQITWAKPEDWDTHRQTITRLYADEDKSLSEVMAIMKRDHSFYAT
jgi:hypothetical protein